jgi:beta-glucosidase
MIPPKILRAKRSVLSIGFLIGLASLAHAKESIDAQIQYYLDHMTIQQKLDYIHGVTPAPGLPNSTGASIAAIPSLGLPEIRNTDGPNGVRSDVPSTLYPAALLLAASWDPQLAWAKGIGIGQDARARGFHIWLGPGMDMYRVPVGGRNSAYLCGEDPYLGSQMLIPLIEAVQHEGVVATSKHFVANDQEYNRGSINTIVDERTLREIYLRPFETAVKTAQSGAIMDAYNQLNGFYSSQSSYLNQLVLAQQWGFDGLIMSDWGAVHDGLQAAQNGLDLEMPGGANALMSSANLYPDYLSGLLSQPAIDDAVSRILRTILNFHFLDRPQLDKSIPQDNPVSAQAGLDSARAGIILLKNDQNILPLDRTKVKSIAVVGSLANGAPPAEGGSGAVTPIHFTSELDGITQAAGNGVKVDFLNILATNPTGNFAPDSNPIAGTKDPTLYQTELYGGSNAVGFYLNGLPNGTAQVTLKFAETYWTNVGQRVFDVAINGKTVLSKFDIVAAAGAPNTAVDETFTVPVMDGTITVTSPNVEVDNALFNAVKVQDGTVTQAYYFGSSPYTDSTGLLWNPYTSLPQNASLPANIATYDAVVVPAGFDSSTEGEGQDRTYTLPSGQDTLISKVVAANPKTIVVLHGGGGMDIQQWVNQVPGLIHAIFPGEDGGIALGEILFGDVNPSGKLPFTFEKRFQDNPAYPNYPSVDGGVTAIYKEGLFMGYRGFDEYGIKPQFPFGYGLSYTTFAYSDLKVTPTSYNNSGTISVSFSVKNIGSKAGAEVAQIYLGKDGSSSVVRPIRELKGFAKVYLYPGESTRITVRLDEEAFAYYDTVSAGWVNEPGVYDIWVGASSRDLRLSGNVNLRSGAHWPVDKFAEFPRQNVDIANQ